MFLKSLKVIIPKQQARAMGVQTRFHTSQMDSFQHLNEKIINLRS